MTRVKETHNNLFDVCLKLEDENENIDSVDINGLFNTIIKEYFFKEEISQNKNFELFLTNLKYMNFEKTDQSIIDLDFTILEKEINGESVNDSLAGKIMLSSQYLKAFYSNHSPSFSKLPEDVKIELLDEIKNKNRSIIDAFHKLQKDKDADSNRKIKTLVALILKNISKRDGICFKKIEKSVEEIINKVFNDSEAVFEGSEKQILSLKDDSNIKEIVKSFFMIKQFDEIIVISDKFKSELDRYIKRTKRVIQKV